MTLTYSSKLFNHDFAIKLLWYDTSCHICCTAHSVLDGLFLYWAQMITNMRGCVMHKDLWPWPISFRSFSHDFAIKLLKYVTSSSVCWTVCTVLDGFCLYLVQMMTTMRRRVTCNDLWLWPISSRSFSHDFSIRLLTYGPTCNIRYDH